MDIRISKSARVCRACERDFVHEEPVYSVVRIQEKELIREDFCSACWEDGRKASAYSHWNTRYYDPRVAEQEPAEIYSPLRQAFYESVESEDRVELAKAFLAAQLLRRQKAFRQIKESDESDGEVKIVLFNDRIGNRLIEVRDPNFTYAELEQGRVLLMQRLQALEAPPAADPVDAAVVDAAPEAGAPPRDDEGGEAEDSEEAYDDEDGDEGDDDEDEFDDDDEEEDDDDYDDDEDDEYDEDDDDDDDEYDDDDDDDDEEDDDEDDVTQDKVQGAAKLHVR